MGHILMRSYGIRKVRVFALPYLFIYKEAGIAALIAMFPSIRVPERPLEKQQNTAYMATTTATFPSTRAGCPVSSLTATSATMVAGHLARRLARRRRLIHYHQCIYGVRYRGYCRRRHGHNYQRHGLPCRLPVLHRGGGVCA